MGAAGGDGLDSDVPLYQSGGHGRISCAPFKHRSQTMQPTATFDPVQTAKSLIRSGKQGALASLMPGTGDPYCSLVNVATAPDGSPVLLISGLAIHTKNILADPRVSLMIDERRAGDPLEGARVMIAGRAEKITDEAALEPIRRRYLLRHPTAERVRRLSRLRVLQACRARRASGRGLRPHRHARSDESADRPQRRRRSARGRGERGRRT